VDGDSAGVGKSPDTAVVVVDGDVGKGRDNDANRVRRIADNADVDAGGLVLDKHDYSLGGCSHRSKHLGWRCSHRSLTMREGLKDRG